MPAFCRNSYRKMESAFSAVVVRVSSSGESIPCLDSAIFPDGGPKSGELVQIHGESNTGKSLLLHELIARIVLPGNCGGHETGAVFIDCENSFNRMMLLSVMEKYILNLADPSVAASLTPQQIGTIQRTALRRLLLVRCYSLEQYELSLVALPDRFLKDGTLSYVLIDSLATFYWSKCTEQNLVRMDTFLRTQCKALRKLAEKWKKTIIFTKPSYFASGGTARDFEHGSPLDGSVSTQVSSLAGSSSRHMSILNEFASSSASVTIEHRIELAEMDSPSLRTSSNEGNEEMRFNAFVTTQDKQYVRFYLIDSFGFNWIEQ
ncbi:DNA repair protein Rad51 homolog [Anopheles ziemanni]|uniref:DNA repair protein Rad51 homolog n=1 Tax=Anopheles coustani TaxID=139045 RepID=UPI0026592868|nr:DNA repair protein Rad51 homolog [Anopheles coustani]XP_058178920.1 DNA repair protein Rad51 homolog [Anopheles ziemanni]